MTDVRLVKYMGIRHNYHQGDTTWYRYKELELSLEFACVNSVALETGETGLALTLFSTRETQGFHWEVSLWDRGSGTFSEKGGNGNWHLFFHPSPYIKVTGRPTNSISPCEETVPHWYENSRYNMFGELTGLVLNEEFRLFSQPGH